MEQNLQKLGSAEQKAVLTKNLTQVLGMNSEDSSKYAEKLHAYYTRLKVFPSSESLLKVSLKATLPMIQKAEAEGRQI